MLREYNGGSQCSVKRGRPRGICRDVSNLFQRDLSDARKSALAYFSIEGGSKPGTIVNNYNPLTQGGVAINKRRTSAQDTELAAFVAFMTDFTTSPLPDSPMMATLKKYCYNAP
jgi:hypothetical protein